MSIPVNLTIKVGDRLDSVTVIEYIGEFRDKSGHLRHKFLVKCDCGIEFEKTTMALLHNRNICKKCKGKNIRIYQNGTKIDKLTVIDSIMYEKGKYIRSIYKCRCECGNIVKKRPSQLRTNAQNDCGKCRCKFRRNGFEEISGTVLCRIKRNAKVRNIEFNVAIEYLWELFIKQNRKCALSGLDISIFQEKTTRPITASLDRIDSTLSYVEGNVQWVHKDINTMKFDLNQEDFIKYCKMVAEHNKV